MTPRQFHSQISVHEDVTNKMYGAKDAPAKPLSNKSDRVGYIDQIPGW